MFFGDSQNKRKRGEKKRKQTKLKTSSKHLQIKIKNGRFWNDLAVFIWFLNDLFDKEKEIFFN